MAFSSRRKVSYFYDPEVGNYYYAQGHPMKPHRMRMTHNLLLAYGLLEKMDVLATPRASQREMTRFHSDEYIKFLNFISPESTREYATSLCRFNVLEDCPVFDGLWEYCQIAAGGSLAGASRLNAGDAEIALNWAGGLHHAKKAEASGFCYINDCVLAILELLKVHARVLYVDIDIHHGDGVEEAFYTTDRVMTTSFHKFGDYFPGTGDVTDIGVSRGKHYSANFPLRDGIDDESYREIFVPVMSRIMEWFQPGAVVLQCGADSLSGDRLGCFNLSLLGHAQCVDFFKRYDKPLLLLGGGGYTIRNVARCWAYETSRVVGETLSDELPYNENYEFYGPEFRLHIVPSNMENHNGPSELHKTKMQIFEHLRHLPHAPSVPMMDTPRHSPLIIHRREEDTGTATVAADDDEDDPDVRKRSRRPKQIIDYAGSDDEYDDQYISSLRYAKRKYKRLNFSRRRFPSAILSSDRNQGEENDYSHGKLPAGLLGHRTAVRRGTSVSTIPPNRDSDVQEWVKSRVYKSRRRDRPLRYYEIDADGMMEDSRRTVSGMSNMKDAEIGPNENEIGHRLGVAHKGEPFLMDARHSSRLFEEADNKSPFIAHTYKAKKREEMAAARRIHVEDDDDDDDDQAALPYFATRRGAVENARAASRSDGRQLDLVDKPKGVVGNEGIAVPIVLNRRENAGESATKKGTQERLDSSEGKEIDKAKGDGSDDDKRRSDEAMSIRVHGSEVSEGNVRRHANGPTFGFTEANASGKNRPMWGVGPYFSKSYKHSDRSKSRREERDEDSDDMEVSRDKVDGAEDGEKSGEGSRKFNRERERGNRKLDTGEMDGEGEGETHVVGDDEKGVGNGDVENVIRGSRSFTVSRRSEGDDDGVNVNDDGGEEADVEGGYGEDSDGGDDDDSDNGHGGDGIDGDVEGASGEAEDTSVAGHGDEGRRDEDKGGDDEGVKRGEEFRSGDVDGMVERSRESAMGNVQVHVDESSGGGEEEEGSVGEGIEESGDGNTTEGRRRAGKEEGEGRGRMRIRGVRPIGRWENWGGKRRAAVLADDGSASEYEDSSVRGSEKRNGKEGSGQEEDGGIDAMNDSMNDSAINDSAKVRDSSGRFVAGSNGRSVDAPR